MHKRVRPGLKGNDISLLFAILFLWSNLENHLHSQNALIAYLPTVKFLEELSSFLRFQILKNWTVQFFWSFSDVKFNCN